jgi:hypothetical protein
MSLAGSALEAALQAVGRGLDAAGDHRLLYCKGAGRLVDLDEDRARDIPLGSGGVLSSVPPNVDVEQCPSNNPVRIRPLAAADEPFVCSYSQVSRTIRPDWELPIRSCGAAFCSVCRALVI